MWWGRPSQVNESSKHEVEAEETAFQHRATLLSALLLLFPRLRFIRPELAVPPIHPKAMLRSHLLLQRTIRRCALSHCLSRSSLNLPIIEPEKFELFDSKLRMDRQLTRVCQSLRSLKKERICEDPVVEAWYTADGQHILETKFCPDVLFVRSHHDKLFQIIRGIDRVILIGNPGISKSV